MCAPGVKCRKVYARENTFEHISFTIILFKMSAFNSVKFSGVFGWYSRNFFLAFVGVLGEAFFGGGWVAGGIQTLSIDQNFNTYENHRLLLIESADCYRIFCSCAHRPWWFHRVLSCVDIYPQSFKMSFKLELFTFWMSRGCRLP